MTGLFVMASELTEKTLWNPLILGVLVTVAGIVLFCGSVYLLLATNTGARLGFLVSAAALTGMMVVLSGIWMTTATPLNSPRGSLPSWEPVEVVEDVSLSSIDAVQDIESGGEEIPEESFGDIRPAIDATLVTGGGGEGEGEESEPSEFAIVGDPSDIILLSSFQTGGDSRWIFWHEPLYQSVTFCIDDDSDDTVPFGELEPDPMCDPELGTAVVVFERDLGNLRQPPVAFFIGSLILFVLSLLGLHWREQDQKERAKAEAAG